MIQVGAEESKSAIIKGAEKCRAGPDFAWF